MLLSNELYAIVRLADNKIVCGLTLDPPIGTSGRPIDYAQKVRHWEDCEARGRVSFASYFPSERIKE